VARVIAGEAGGRRLAVPDGRATRPTSDRAREGLFGTVASIVGPLTGTRMLDLYAGSGAVGLEALSRGAEHVLLVESGARATAVIRQNIEVIGLPGATLIADRVERVLARGPEQTPRVRDQAAPGPEQTPAPDGDRPEGAQDFRERPGSGRFDVAFADPPYAMADAEISRVLSLLADEGWLAPEALVIVERATRSGPVRWPDGFVPDRARKYGEATFWYGLAPKSPGIQGC
jgi:16S rRNA (guanine966-N2)-methyltransferase